MRASAPCLTLLITDRPIRKVPVRTRVDFWLDAALLVAFTLDYSFNFTGLTIHEWIGIGFGFESGTTASNTA